MEKKTHLFCLTITHFLRTKTIEEGSLLNSAEEIVDPYCYYDLKRGANALTKMRSEKVRSCYKDDDENILRVQTVLEEMAPLDAIKFESCNGTNEIEEIFNQNCFKICKSPSVYAFRRCGHHCICESVVPAALKQLAVHKVCILIRTIKMCSL